ncbi:hypothetical protein TNCV_1974661 [Trichonephila clavipes]|nr:hypothetical protein TNCV_1974661 [Trichonephila clavipes]
MDNIRYLSVHHSGRGSRVVKVLDRSWPSHIFESNTPKDPPCRIPSKVLITASAILGASGLYRVPTKSPSEGPFPFLVTLLRRLGIPRCDWASVEDLGSVCIEHMILSCLGESSCP